MTKDYQPEQHIYKVFPIVFQNMSRNASSALVDNYPECLHSCKILLKYHQATTANSGFNGNGDNWAETPNSRFFQKFLWRISNCDNAEIFHYVMEKY